jgi:hypothetical protein
MSMAGGLPMAGEFVRYPADGAAAFLMNRAALHAVTEAAGGELACRDRPQYLAARRASRGTDSPSLSRAELASTRVSLVAMTYAVIIRDHRSVMHGR